ncbi:MAG: MarR family transcriptional regulator [Clostridiales bacterium]|nr:MarR family transcriptional regulator [Clostridiales bacterium]MCC8099009.1 MarR family transcriptional regulator [Clostridiales bacterium]
MNQQEQATELLFLLRRCGHRLHGKRGGGKLSQQRVLRILTKYGEQTQHQLQERMGVQQGSLSELVKKLETQGLVMRTRAPQDRRQVLIRLTDAGRAESEAKHQRFLERNEALFAPLSQEEQTLLREMLTRLLQAWEEQDEEERARQGKQEACH